MSSAQALSALDRQIARAATDVLKSTVGENIERVAAQVAEKVPGVSAAAALRVIDDDWRAITAAAGMGPFAVTKFSGSASDGRRIDLTGTVAGQMLPHAKTAAEVLSTRAQRAAGTVSARQYKRGDDMFVVQGPQYWQLMNHPKPFDDSWLQRVFDRGLSLAHLDGLREKIGYDITRLHIDRVWSTGEKEKALRGISGSEIEALTQPGPNGEPAALQPGDALLCGGGGDGGLTHCILYAGPAPANHPDAGAPMIIHAMATLKEGASRAEWIAGKLGGLGDSLLYDLHLEQQRPDTMTGVLYERLGHFFNRYHRDSIMVLRDATLTPAQIEKGLAYAQQLTGYDAATGEFDPTKRVGYDYRLRPDNLVSRSDKYCTEVWLGFDYVAHDMERKDLPYVGTAYYNQGSPLGTVGVHAFVAEPEDLAISPDLQPVLVAGGGAYALAEAQRLRLQSPIASMPRSQRPILEPIPAGA